MTRSDLIRRISEIYPYMSIKNVDRIITILLRTIERALRDGNRVELRGFGSFSVRQRGASVGRNPRTGAVIEVDGKNVPFFKAGKQLKDLINGRISSGD